MYPEFIARLRHARNMMEMCGSTENFQNTYYRQLKPLLDELLLDTMPPVQPAIKIKTTPESRWI